MDVTVLNAAAIAAVPSARVSLQAPSYSILSGRRMNPQQIAE
jgi:hypothetical protein